MAVIEDELIFVTQFRRYNIPMKSLKFYQFQGYEKRSQKVALQTVDGEYHTYIGLIEGGHDAVRAFFKELNVDEKPWGILK